MITVSQSELRGGLRRVVVSWLFGAAWMYMVSGAIFTRYAKLLHVSPFGFGLLATIPFIGALAQLPASLVLERYGYRRQIFFWCALLHRMLWLVIAGLPWLFPPLWQWAALLTVLFISSLLANIAGTAWVAWMGALVPGQLRGRYFSRRTQLGQAVGLVLSFLCGLMLDWPDPDEQVFLRNIISSVFALASVAGMIEILMFTKVPDGGPVVSHPSVTLRSLVAEPLADRNFRRFLGYAFTITFATGFMGQFVWLYLFDVVGMSNNRANLLLVSIPLLAGMVSYPFWGRVVDRFGSKLALIAAGVLVINGGAAWVFVTRDSWIPAYLCTLLATAAWAGMDIGGFNWLLRKSDGGGKHRGNSAVIAINSVVVAVGGTLSGVFGGSVAQWLGDDWRMTLPGVTLTYHGVLFLASALLRVAAVGWLCTLQEPEGKMATRQALRYMMGSVYSNLLQATFFPARVLIKLAGLSWKMPGHR